MHFIGTSYLEHALKTQHPDWTKRPEIMKRVLQYNGLDLAYVSDEFKSDPEIVMVAVQQTDLAWQFAAPALREDRKYQLLAAVHNSSVLKCEELAFLRKDTELLLQVLAQKVSALRIPDSVLRYADPSLRASRAFMLQAVRLNSCELEYADASLKRDKEVVLAAVKQGGLALEHADASLKEDEEVVFAAVTQNGLAFKYADRFLKHKREVVLAAVKQNGWALSYGGHAYGSGRGWQKDREVVLEVLMQNPTALGDTDASLRNDREVVLAAVMKQGSVLRYADASLREDREVVLAAVKQDGFALQYVEGGLNNDAEIVEAATQNKPKAVLYAGTNYADQKDRILQAIRARARGEAPEDPSLLDGLPFEHQLCPL